MATTDEVFENNHLDLDGKIEFARKCALAINKWTFWNGRKKASYILEVIEKIEVIKSKPENLSLTTEEILSQTQSDNGKTLYSALGWHRLPSLFNEHRSMQAHSLSLFQESVSEVEPSSIEKSAHL